MPALFWSLALLSMPQHEPTAARVLAELQEAAQQQRQHAASSKQQQDKPSGPAAAAEGGRGAGGIGSLDAATTAAMIQLAMDRQSWVSKCVAEAIRLRAHSIAGETRAEWGHGGAMANAASALLLVLHSHLSALLPRSACARCSPPRVRRPAAAGAVGRRRRKHQSAGWCSHPSRRNPGHLPL